MSSQSSGAGRRRLNLNEKQQYSAEDEALNIISNEAEARLAAKRAARTEAREIRLKELEKQQNESDVKQDNAAPKTRQQLSGSRSGSRRGSTESNDSDAKDTDFKAELRELEMKYKSAMVTSAQLDNEKQALVYQVEILKDQLEEQDEQHTELQREYKEKCRQYDFTKRDLQSMEHDLNILKQQLEIKDTLIERSGFVILTNEKGEPIIQKSSQLNSSNGPAGAFLVSTEMQEVLRKAEGATLGTALTDVNTNQSGVSSKAGTQAGCLITSSSDEVDGAMLESVLMSEMCSGDNIRLFSEKPANNVVLHDMVSDECMSHKHELSRVEATHKDSGDRICLESESRISSNDCGVSPLEADAEATTQQENSNNSGLSNNDSSNTAAGSESYTDAVDNETDEVEEFFDAVSTPSPPSHTKSFDRQGIDDQKVLISDNEGSSVDPEINTEEDILRLQKLPTFSSTDTDRGSVVVENATETESSTDTDRGSLVVENVTETESSTDTDRGSLVVENVTETESSTDIDRGSLVVENATETESSTDTDRGSLVVENATETESNTDTDKESLFVENVTETESSTDVRENNDDVSKEDALETENSPFKVDKGEDNVNIQNITDSEISTDTKDENEDDVDKDVLRTESSMPEVDENNGKITIQNVTESESSDDKKIEIDEDIKNVTETESSDDKKVEIDDNIGIQNVGQSESSTDIIHESEVNNNEDVVAEAVSKEDKHGDIVDIMLSSRDELAAEELVSREDVTSVESTEDKPSSVDETAGNDITVEAPSSEQHSDNTLPSLVELGQDDADTSQHVEIEETGLTVEITQSVTCDLQNSGSLNNIPDAPDQSCTTESLEEDTPEKQENEDIIKEGEDTGSELSKDKLNTESEVVNESEDNNNLECIKSQVDDSDEQTEEEKDARINALQAVNDIGEEDKDEKDGGLSGKDATTIAVRKASMGGSEASEGLGLDDYDLDDIDDILKTDDLSSVDENSAAIDTHAESTVAEAAESAAQQDKQSAGVKDIERKEDTKTKDSKKSKEKVKSSKKEAKEKSKSSIKESKDKTEKRKSKELDKIEKSKSKKEDSQDKKKDKNKHSKKEGDKAEAVGGEEDRNNLDESQTSIVPDDLEGALDKQMKETATGKPHKKSSKKLSIFKKVFK